MPRDGATIAREAFVEAMRPPPILTVSEWADRYRMLPGGAAEAGRYRTDRTPYMREVMDVLSDHSPVWKAVIVAAGQVGKTTGADNWIGYIVHHAPAPTMFVMPTLESARNSCRVRLDPLFESTPELAERVASPRSRDASNTSTFKDFPGGPLMLAGANAAAGLRASYFRNLVADEIDAYPRSAGEEGDPLKLAERGTRTFGYRRKIYLVSTPTIAGRSRIEREYNNTDRRRYWVPCPECGAFQVLKWAHVRYEREGDHGPPIKGSERYVCADCGVLIPERHKEAMVAAGEWRADAGEKSDEVAGFHLSALYAPPGWYSWWDAIRDFHEAQGVPENLRVWVNTVLAETWKEKGDAPPWEELYNRRERYKIGTVPKGAVVLTAGVDVQGGQGARLEVEVVGWGRDRESWSVDYVVIPGDPAEPEVWRELDRFLETTYPRAETEDPVPIRMLAIDSGFSTQEVYNWVRGKPRTRVMAVKGREGQAAIVSQPRAVDVTTAGKRLRRGVQLWTVGVDHAKSEFYGALRQKRPTNPTRDGYPPGYCHFPQYAEEYFKQLTAEEIVPREVRGYVRYVWEKTRDRNEALDCRVYARAAAAVVGIDRWTEEQWQEAEGTAPSGDSPTEPRRRRSSSGYLSNRRERRGTWRRRRRT